MRIRFLKASAIALSLLTPLLAHAVGVQIVVDGRTVVLTDVQQSAWFATYVRQAAELGIVSGYRDVYGNPTGKFGPSNSITVAEALKIVVEGAGYDTDAYATLVDSGVRHWSSVYVAVGKSEGFPVVGNTARLDRSATRAEVAALFTAAFRVDASNTVVGTRYEDVRAGMSYAPAIEQLSQDRVVSGDTDIHGQAIGTFRPNAFINRAEVAKMIITARAAYGTPGAGRGPAASSSNQAASLLVRYTNAGFSPAVLHVRRGQTVTFRNDSTGNLWVASNPHPIHTDLSGFDALRPLGASETYVYTFTRLGTFGYHNHLNAAHQGTIVVEP